jgi:hypothetical protein
VKYLLSLTLLSVFPSGSPHIDRVSGRVTDTLSGNAVANATVSIDGVSASARTDSAGRFVVRVRRGEALVRTRRIGYYPGKGRATLVGDGLDRLEIGLDPARACLDECTHPPVPTLGYVRATRLPNTR